MIGDNRQITLKSEPNTNTKTMLHALFDINISTDNTKLITDDTIVRFNQLNILYVPKISNVRMSDEVKFIRDVDSSQWGSIIYDPEKKKYSTNFQNISAINGDIGELRAPYINGGFLNRTSLASNENSNIVGFLFNGEKTSSGSITVDNNLQKGIVNYRFNDYYTGSSPLLIAGSGTVILEKGKTKTIYALYWEGEKRPLLKEITVEYFSNIINFKCIKPNGELNNIYDVTVW